MFVRVLESNTSTVSHEVPTTETTGARFMPREDQSHPRIHCFLGSYCDDSSRQKKSVHLGGSEDDTAFFFSAMCARTVLLQMVELRVITEIA